MTTRQLSLTDQRRKRIGSIHRYQIVGRGVTSCFIATLAERDG